MPFVTQAAARLNPYLPWLDRAGRVSAFKTLVFALLLLPGFYVAWQLATHGYARPYILANHDLGDWAIRLLFVTLAVTPLRQSLGLPKLIQVRRMIGVAAFCYAMAHLIFYALDKSLQIGVVAREIVLRPRGRRFRLPRDRSLPVKHEISPGRRRGSASRAAIGALRIGRSVGAALADQRLLAPTEGRMVAAAGVLLLVIGIVGFLWPALIAWPLAVLVTWIAVSFLLRARELRRERRQRGLPPTRVGHAEPPPAPPGSE